MSDVLERPQQLDFDRMRTRPNFDQTPIGTSGRWSLEKLLALSQEEGVALWRTLPAPTLEEMNGHYTGLGPRADNPEAQREYARTMYNERTRYWLGKGFRALSETEGEGYNRWRLPGGRVIRNLRMKTRIAPSIIDGNPVFALDYPALNKSTLWDEVRKLDDSVYACTASVAAAGGERSPLRFFLLLGPTDEWVGAPYAEG